MVPAFNFEDLKEIVKLAGELLEREDRSIRESFNRNPVYGGSAQVPGIMNLNLKDERYYQRLTWRALQPSFRYIAEVEYKTVDIALFEAGQKFPTALGQMKLWMDRGFKGVKESLKDMAKLAKRKGTSYGQFLLIFTSAGFTNPGVPYLDTFVKEALGRLGCSEKEHFLYRFNATYDENGHGTLKDGEFGVLGVHLR